MTKKNDGKQFETDIETSCKDQHIFYFRVRDVNPMALKPKFKIPQNKYDALLYNGKYLFPVELKSIKDMNISLKESMIKAYQIKSLKEATEYENVISGFIFNFRNINGVNKAYFVHIDDFITYKNIAENGLEHTYKNKINRSSIPHRIVEEIGIEIRNSLKQVHYRFYVRELLDRLIEKYSGGDKS